MRALLTDDFVTNLRTIRTWVETDRGNRVQHREKFRLTTEGLEIYLQTFDLKQIWAPETNECESGKGWRWFIHKTNQQKEQLNIFCKLINPSSDTEWGSNSGEHLDAIEIENKTNHLHIKTKDGEMMQYRAEALDWMPDRYKSELSIYKSLTEYIDFGFKTTVQNLEQGDRIYFHYIVATNQIKPSKDYPDERDISTWFAVDQSKKNLDEKLANTASNLGF